MFLLNSSNSSYFSNNYFNEKLAFDNNNAFRIRIFRKNLPSSIFVINSIIIAN